jgi:CHAT domain-containing protein
VLLKQKRNEEALQLWEWYQTRPLLKESGPQSSSSKWQDIEQAILRQPLPSTSTTRLVYASTRCCLHIWTIGPAGISAVSIPEKRDDLRRKIREFIEKCGMRQDPELHVPEPDAESKELFSQLLQPVMANLRPSETVVIDLDTGMNALPVEALKSPEGWYFGQRFPVVYSAGYFKEMALRRISQQKPRLGLGLYALGSGERNGFSGVFPELRTVDAADINPADLSALLEPSEMFAFLGHGDELGGLVLKKGRPVLKAKDFPLESLRHMSLAVLAGCSTGVTMHDFLDTGDLVRAFHSAGTPSVIASHWNVNMEATSELMTSLSRHLSDGESVAHALFEARKETFKKYNHPYYWAGFVLSGRA